MQLKENPTPYMGEVRTKVRLLNIADASAVAEGRLSPERVRMVEADALVDTDAIRSCVPASLMEKLGIKPYNQGPSSLRTDARAQWALPMACASRSWSEVPVTTR